LRPTAHTETGQQHTGKKAEVMMICMWG
jgi:hypothetical protein